MFELQWLLLNCPKPGCWAQLLKALPIGGLLPVPSPWGRGGVGGAVQSETSVQVAGAHLPSLRLPEQSTQGSQAASAQAPLVRPPPGDPPPTLVLETPAVAFLSRRLRTGLGRRGWNSGVAWIFVGSATPGAQASHGDPII